MRRLQLPVLSRSVLIPTQRACDLIGDSMAPINHVRVSEYEHSSQLFDVAQALITKFNATWISERRLRQLNEADSHIPDGILRREDGDIAIELELTPKAPRRLADILAEHAANLAVRETWYVIDSEAVEKLVRRLAVGYPQIKIVRFNRRKGHG
jgi:hypothetical protein